MERAEINRILRLHRQAYRALMWINHDDRARGQMFAPAEIDLLEHEQTCERWLSRHLAQLPEELRPGSEEAPAFARLLSSFFTTSFEVGAGGRLINRSRNPRKKRVEAKDRQAMLRLQQYALEELAETAGLDCAADRAARISEDGDLQQDRTLWAYVVELRRRAQFVSQGTAVHQMWLALSPVVCQRLDADKVWAARDRLLDRLRKASSR